MKKHEETFASVTGESSIRRTVMLESAPATPPAQRAPTCDEKIGMAWWNSLSRPERRAALVVAEAKLGRDVSAADAWAVWKLTNAGNNRLRGPPSNPGVEQK